MPRVQWPLHQGRPCIQVVLTQAPAGQALLRTLLADTGAATGTAALHLLLAETDCLLCGGSPGASLNLHGAYAGPFTVYGLRVQVPALGFDQPLRAVGIPQPPRGFDGIACFSFLDRFTCGNFGDPTQFGLEC
jgi:hypothetical protein